jgi:proteasome lid subunit RPN8/RPN11
MSNLPDPAVEPHEIEFGDLKARESTRRLRPDRDGHYAVAVVGKALPDQLPIFVDLDVMRELEAHANSNTDVELGGVLLGWQARDDQGRPFVQIVDSLRAEHYEATRGSFKFTHETWSEITRRRQQLHPELQLVGWYHTHPGWGVFLSEMDRFICDHFFAAAEDVALVIDPRQQTRGWFQWLRPGKTGQLQGWHLTAHRHRQREVDYYSRLYSGAAMPHFDPRYSEPPATGTTTVQLVDRSNQLTLIGWLLLGTQTLVLLLVALRLLTLPLSTAAPAAASAASSSLPAEAATAAADLALARSEVYREVLASLLVAEGKSPDLAKLFADSQLEKEQLAASNRSHASRIAQLEQSLAERTKQTDRLNADLNSLAAKLESTKATRSSLPDGQAPATFGSAASEEASGWWQAGWVLPALLGALVVSMGALAASLFRGAQLARHVERLNQQHRPRPNAEPSPVVEAEREPAETATRN